MESRSLGNPGENDSGPRRRCPHISGLESHLLSRDDNLKPVLRGGWCKIGDGNCQKMFQTHPDSHYAFSPKSMLTAHQEKSTSYSVELCHFLWINQLHKNKIGSLARHSLTHTQNSHKTLF